MTWAEIASLLLAIGTIVLAPIAERRIGRIPASIGLVALMLLAYKAA